MRLIDGDYLYNKLVANKCPYDLVLQMVKEEPTVCDIEQIKAELYHECCKKYQKTCEIYQNALEQIRAEIIKLQDEWFKETDGWYCYEKVLQIIDKYKGE